MLFTLQQLCDVFEPQIRLKSFVVAPTLSICVDQFNYVLPGVQVSTGEQVTLLTPALYVATFHIQLAYMMDGA